MVDRDIPCTHRGRGVTARDVTRYYCSGCGALLGEHDAGAAATPADTIAFGIVARAALFFLCAPHLVGGVSRDAQLAALTVAVKNASGALRRSGMPPELISIISRLDG
jgi:hypothetical protein